MVERSGTDMLDWYEQADLRYEEMRQAEVDDQKAFWNTLKDNLTVLNCSLPPDRIGPVGSMWNAVADLPFDTDPAHVVFVLLDRLILYPKSCHAKHVYREMVFRWGQPENWIEWGQKSSS